MTDDYQQNVSGQQSKKEKAGKAEEAGKIEKGGKTEKVGRTHGAGPAERKVLIVSVLSTVLWAVSIVLSFVIKPGDSRIFMPDALLLLGFFPLLWLWRRGWITFLFGLLTA